MVSRLLCLTPDLCFLLDILECFAITKHEVQREITCKGCLRQGLTPTLNVAWPLGKLALY